MAVNIVKKKPCRRCGSEIDPDQITCAECRADILSPYG